MAEANQISCPHCGQPYFVLPEQWGPYHGRTIPCAKCGGPFVVTAPAGTYLAPYGLSGAPQYPAGPPPTSGWAIASLVTGIVGFCPLWVIGSLAAVITGTVGLVQTSDRRRSGRGLAIAGLVLGIIGLVGLLLLLPVLNVAREQTNRVKCASNMKMLGRAMATYANQSGGRFPDRLQDVLQADASLPATVFVCPDDSKTPPAGSTPQMLAAQIAGPNHCSYIYVGNGLTTAASADTVLLFEPLSNHHDGMNVLFANGSVKWVDRTAAQRIRQQHTAGVTPIRLPRPTTGPQPAVHEDSPNQ